MSCWTIGPRSIAQDPRFSWAIGAPGGGERETARPTSSWSNAPSPAGTRDLRCVLQRGRSGDRRAVRQFCWASVVIASVTANRSNQLRSRSCTRRKFVGGRLRLCQPSVSRTIAVGIFRILSAW